MARKVSATTGPTPGIVIRRRHTSSSRTMANKRRCRMPTCSRKLGMHPRQVENRSDFANQVIVGNGLFKTKRIKQLSLVVVKPPHHRPPPQRIASEPANHSARVPSTTFATKSANCDTTHCSKGIAIRSAHRRGQAKSYRECEA